MSSGIWCFQADLLPPSSILIMEVAGSSKLLVYHHNVEVFVFIMYSVYIGSELYVTLRSDTLFNSQCQKT
jgi:hypothetical protein